MRPVSVLAGLPALLLVLGLTVGCSGSEDAPEPDAGGGGGGSSSSSSEGGGPDPRFVKQVRANVPGAQAYSDAQLEGIADQVCALGKEDLAVQILDNYSGLEPADYHEFAQITLHTAC